MKIPHSLKSSFAHEFVFAFVWMVIIHPEFDKSKNFGFLSISGNRNNMLTKIRLAKKDLCWENEEKELLPLFA